MTDADLTVQHYKGEKFSQRIIIKNRIENIKRLHRYSACTGIKDSTNVYFDLGITLECEPDDGDAHFLECHIANARASEIEEVGG